MISNLFGLLKFTVLKSIVHFLSFGRKRGDCPYILLIRNDHLGDFLVSLPLFMQIHEIAAKRGEKVMIVIDENIRSFVERCPCFDEIISIRINDFAKSYKKKLLFYAAFNVMNFSCSINFVSVGRTVVEDYIVYFSKAKVKAVVETSKIWSHHPAITASRKRTKNFYTDILAYRKDMTIVENESCLASVAMGEKIYPVLGNLNFLKPFDKPQAKSPFFLVVPGAQSVQQRWEAEKFAFVIDAVVEKYPELTPVLSGTENERGCIEEVIRASKYPERIVNLCGRSSVMELTGNIAGAEFVLTNDTGPVHIAAKLKRKTFCVFGMGHFGAYNPNPLYKSVEYFHSNCETPGCNWLCEKECFPERFYCVRILQPEPVASAICKYIETIRQNGFVVRT